MKTLKFKEKEVTLPKFTLHFEQKHEELNNLNRKLIAGAVSRVEVLRKCYEFLSELLGESTVLNLLEGNSIEDVDTKELELLFLLVITEYERPVKEEKVKLEKRINFDNLGTNIKEIIQNVQSTKND